MPPVTPKSILLIDDEDNMHQLTHAHLEKAGFRVFDAYDGPSGLELALRESPDLILLDHLMPNMNGEEVFKQLSTDERFTELRNVPVIVLTGQGATESSRVSLIERGVAAYLQKPFGLRELSDVIDNVFVIQDIRRRNKQLRAEQEKSNYRLRMLHSIGLAMQSAIDLDELLHLILTSITAGQAMGFSRAMIFLCDAQGASLQGKMGVGPVSAEEAGRIWPALANENLALEAFLEKYGKRKPEANDAFDGRVRAQRLILAGEPCEFINAIKKTQTYRGIPGAARCDACSTFLEALELKEFIAAPLVAKDTLIGLIIADHLYGVRQPIHDELIVQLELFARQAAMAIEKADAYQRLEEEKAKLERAYGELKATHLQLVHAERLATVGKMATQVAHEIRNPLVTIGGFARSLIKKAQGNEAIEKIAGVIAEEALRLEIILADVLNYTRLPKPIFQQADLNKIVRDVCALLSEEARRQRIRIALQLAPLPLLRLDSGQINQVLHNLLRNAMQSFGETRPDDAEGRGTIACATRMMADERVCLEVTDTGAGIPPEVLDNMFDPFFTTKPQGTGLGLPITLQIINEHGGQIEVTSKVGSGTTFFVYLPMS